MKPQPRQVSLKLTLHERRMLEAWASQDVTLEQLAARFSTSRSNVSRTLQRARAKSYGLRMNRVGARRHVLIPMQSCAATDA
jgi:IS30 family transposase